MARHLSSQANSLAHHGHTKLLLGNNQRAGTVPKATWHCFQVWIGTLTTTTVIYYSSFVPQYLPPQPWYAGVTVV